MVKNTTSLLEKGRRDGIWECPKCHQEFSSPGKCLKCKAKEFIPTHRLKHDIPQLNLKSGILLRQINPLAGSNDICKCVEQNDRSPWLLNECDLEPLADWPEIRAKMIEDIVTKRS